MDKKIKWVGKGKVYDLPVENPLWKAEILRYEAALDPHNLHAMKRDVLVFVFSSGLVQRRIYAVYIQLLQCLVK